MCDDLQLVIAEDVDGALIVCQRVVERYFLGGQAGFFTTVSGFCTSLANAISSCSTSTVLMALV